MPGFDAFGADYRESGRDILNVLRRRWPVLALAVVVCVAIGIVHHAGAVRSYVATSSVAFQNGSLSESALQVAQSGSSEPQRQADTEVLVAHSPAVATAVAQRLHVKVASGELLKQVKVETAPNADVLNIIATTNDPSYSARLANAFAQQYLSFRAQAQLAGLTRAQAQLRSQYTTLPSASPERQQLEQSYQRLSELRAVAGSGASIIGLASPPTEPSGTTFKTTIILALILGLAIGLSVIFLMETLDRRLRSIEDFERAYRLPALVAIPELRVADGGASVRAMELEPFRILRSAVDVASATQRLDALLMTSAVLGEGKTTVSVDLAHAMALAGRRVALVEFDLRRPSFARHFDVPADRGFTSLFSEKHEIEDVLLHPFPELDNFSVLPAGRRPHNPAELLSSSVVTDVLEELSANNDVVIVDGPPLNPVADAQVLLGNQAIRSVLVVARLDLTTRDQVSRARAILDRHTREPIGLVVTGLRETSRYGYERYSNVPERSQEPDQRPKQQQRANARPRRSSRQTSRSTLAR